ncbi:hypothetical protein [Novosphingopyxis sp.]|uniref:hypothetical protein n=1 Tax=Novosphingopyxis sp. TaxID=2709690 RepID=UPI003B5974BC
MTDFQEEQKRRGPGFYAGLMLAAFSAIAGLRISEAINGVTGFLLMAGAMLLLIPLVRASLAQQKRCGVLSPAVARYTRRFMISSFGYVLGLGIAVWLNNNMELEGVVAFGVALLPVIPILGMVWTMGRYLVEEKDEYLRQRAMIANIVGLGAVLSIGSFWGFLETFELVPHIPGWWAVPIWAIGLGVGQCWMALRDRADMER